MHDHRQRVVMGAALVAGMAIFVAAAHGQMSHGAHAPAAAPPPVHATMSELHARGGVPAGWKFLVPPGDASDGRKVFVAMECFACHEVKGESFPKESKTPRGSGPELTGMGAHHPAEYFAESILNPNRVIVDGQGYTGPDRLSKMPSYADTMTLKQLVDVVAYLGSLKDDAARAHHDMGGSMKMK